MHPDLIDLGFLHVKTYGACMAAGFLLCWHLVERLSGRKDVSNLLMYLMLAGVAGSRAAYVVEHWSAEFAAAPLDVFKVWQGGLMFYGGLVLALAVFFVWCRVKKENVVALADVLSVAVPLGHACGRIGCFFYGCCYGRDSDAWCAVVFPEFSPSWYEHGRRLVGVLPVQLFEAAALLALFAVLLAVYLKTRRHTTGIYLVGYAAIRFGLEFLRGDPRAAFCGLSIGQLISIGTALAGAAFLAYGERTRDNR
ncbi:MAG: prolipoprotein diacylglyceryl transferase [Kiritimatiellae bacterium]|nr:prolipoprotein diacylglyceryl transferase [Kiritimatiellia bacterium]